MTDVPVHEDDQAWFWTKEWQQKEKEADEDLAAGRTTVYLSSEDFLASLDDEVHEVVDLLEYLYTIRPVCDDDCCQNLSDRVEKAKLYLARTSHTVMPADQYEQIMLSMINLGDDTDG